jgi:hypothetical protein
MSAAQSNAQGFSQAFVVGLRADRRAFEHQVSGHFEGKLLARSAGCRSSCLLARPLGDARGVEIHAALQLRSDLFVVRHGLQQALDALLAAPLCLLHGEDRPGALL